MQEYFVTDDLYYVMKVFFFLNISVCQIRVILEFMKDILLDICSLYFYLSIFSKSKVCKNSSAVLIQDVSVVMSMAEKLAGVVPSQSYSETEDESEE